MALRHLRRYDAVKISILAADGRIAAKRPSPSADYVVIPHCPACTAEPCHVRGKGVSHHDHDTYYSRAVALCCSADIGELQATVDTIFGIEEDNAVLVHGRARVYDGSRGGRP